MGNAGATQTSQGVEAKAGAAWRPDIQGLRAIAVLVVVAYHADLPIPGGFVGVDIFFVISGYVITAMLQREWDRAQSLDLRRFYLRRFKRLMPALALAVSATAVISIFVLSPFESQTPTALTGVGAMLFGANLVIANTSGGYFDAPAEANALLNTWSLSVEEQFYLVFPLLLLLGWSVGRRLGHTSAAFVAVAFGGLASFILAVVNSWGWIPPVGGILMGFYGPVTRAWEFAAGALLALASAGGTGVGKSARLRAIVSFAGLVLVAVSVFAIDPWVPYPGFWTLLPVTATVLVIWGGSATASPASRLLASKPLVRVGDWSYSIYLWHWPFIVFAAYIWHANTIALVIAAALSFAPAVASYRWVEQPLRQANIRGKRQVTSLVTLTLLPPLALCAFLALGSNRGWWLDWPEDVSAGQAAHAAYANCTDKLFDPAKCTWNADAPNGEVLVVGDSQAYALADGTIQAARSLGMSTVANARSGCPFAEIRTTGTHSLDCPSWQQQVLTYALETRPKVVVVANRSTGYTNPGWRQLVAPDGNPVSYDAAASTYERALGETVQQLRAAGIGVVVVHNIPELSESPSPPSLFTRLFSRVPEPLDATGTLAQRHVVAEVERRIAADQGAVTVDPADGLCGGDNRCPLVNGDGQAVWLDSWHLTKAGSEQITPALERAISQAAAATGAYAERREVR